MASSQDHHSIPDASIVQITAAITIQVCMVNNGLEKWGRVGLSVDIDPSHIDQNSLFVRGSE